MAAIEFRLPDVGEGIATAEIVAWRVAAGDHVQEGQDLVEVQTDKAIVVIPCPTTGVVTRLGGQPGDTIDTGAVLALFEDELGGEDDALQAPDGVRGPPGSSAGVTLAPDRPGRWPRRPPVGWPVSWAST